MSGVDAFVNKPTVSIGVGDPNLATMQSLEPADIAMPDPQPAQGGPCASCQTRASIKCAQCKGPFYCDRACQKSDWPNHKAVCLAPPTEDVPVEVDTSAWTLKCQVRASPVHGQGVWATHPIARGEPVAYFAGQIRDTPIKVTMQKFPDEVLGIKRAARVFRTICQSQKDMDRCLAIQDSSHPHRVVFGHETPPDAFGTGQFINDACQPRIRTRDFPSMMAALSEYQADSTQRANCEVDQRYAFVATRDINAGQELFTHYGPEFWCQKYLLDSASPVERLLFYSVMNQSRKPFDLRRFYTFNDETCRAFLKVMIQVPDADEPDFEAKKYICQVTDQINIQAPEPRSENAGVSSDPQTTELE